MHLSALMTAFAIAALTCLVLLPVGCGGPKTIAAGNPKATAEAFVEAMKAGDYETVAAGYDYETAARQDNPDWDTFGQSQRNLIVGKLQEGRAEEVKALGGMMSGEVQVGAAEIQGDRATVPLTVGVQTLNMHLIEVEGLWKVLEVVEG